MLNVTPWTANLSNGYIAMYHCFNHAVGQLTCINNVQLAALYLPEKCYQRFTALFFQLAGGHTAKVRRAVAIGHTPQQGIGYTAIFLKKRSFLHTTVLYKVTECTLVSPGTGKEVMQNSHGRLHKMVETCKSYRHRMTVTTCIN